MQSKAADKDARIATVEADVHHLRASVGQVRDEVGQVREEVRGGFDRIWNALAGLSDKVSSRGQVNYGLLLTLLGVLATWTAIIGACVQSYVSLRLEPFSQRLDADRREAELRERIGSSADEISVYRARFGELTSQEGRKDHGR
jgi:hypothetical protein